MADDDKTGPARGGGSWWRRFRDAPNDSPGKTLVVTLAVALFGSILVAGSAVLLRPLQIANKEAERQKRVLEIVRQLPDADALDIEARIVDLQSGEYVDVAPEQYDQRRAAKDPQQSVAIPREADVAGLRTRARFAVVYLARREGRTRMVILPVRGRGYASMLYGYIGLADDWNTVVALTFFEHAETPGLGALVDSPVWKAQWRGLKVRDPGGIVRLGAARGRVPPGSPDAPYQVDGLTGATWTSNGVTHLLHYWLGEQGFGPYLRKLKGQ